MNRGRILKLDLHTHCCEATCIYDPTLETVKKIVDAVIAKGLDGIGITEHHNKAYGFRVREIVDRYCDGRIIVIPGEEVDRGNLHIVNLYLPDNLTFRFIAHPGFSQIRDFAAAIDGTIHGIELRNPYHDSEMDESAIRRVAEKYNMVLLCNSDAHFLSDIGKYYNEITIEELCARAR